jgi:hypothetical protein
VTACQHDGERRADHVVLAVDDGGDGGDDAFGGGTDVRRDLGVESGAVDDRASG